MPVRRLRAHLAALLALLFLLLPVTSEPALAQSCTISVTSLAFGSVDVTANAQVDSTANVTVSCTGTPLSLVGICVDIGPGSGGATDATSRFMANGASTLRYGLYSDAAATTPWGSGAWPGGAASPVGFNITLSVAGAGSQSRTLYGRVHSGQATASPLAYASSFSGTDSRIRYGPLSFVLGCDVLTSIRTTSFTVTADVPATCRISTNALDFGATGVLAAQQDASTSLAPTCTNGTPYQLGLNGGLSGAADPTQRKMTKASEFIVYGLYRNAARTQAFGNTIGVDTHAAAGSGLAQPVTVYGRISPQTTPSPGLYTDTIVATVTY